jgi:hypothetical protein
MGFWQLKKPTPQAWLPQRRGGLDLSKTTSLFRMDLSSTTYVAMTAWKRLHGQGNPKVDTASQSSLTSQAMTYERLRGAGNV